MFNVFFPQNQSMQNALKSENMLEPAEIMTPLTEILYAFSMIAFYCEFSEEIIAEFDKFNEELSRCEWYLFSNELQQMYLTFILDTQQPKLIQGYGNIMCTRDTFKKV